MPTSPHSHLLAFLALAALTVVTARAADDPPAATASADGMAAANDAPPADLIPEAPPELPDPAALPLPAAPPPAATPTANVTINLINRLVEKGILTRAEAADMIRQAQEEAAAVAAAQHAPVLPPLPSPEEEVRVTYIPTVVRDEMRDEIKQDLMAQASKEGWGLNKEPSWTSKFRPFGDLRVRSENIFFPDGNSTLSFPNFNAINRGSPYDVSGIQYPPMHNVDQDRHRFRLRARLGTEITLGQGFDSGLRIATGDGSGATSTNQTLGGSGGSFSKYAIWLDRAFLRYSFGPGDGDEAALLAGRFDNPFFSTEMQWDEDIGFDGLAVRGKGNAGDTASVFLTAGIFPVYNTDLNFSSNQPEKFESEDKWLTGAQLGVDWKLRDDLTARFAVAYYDFDNIGGRLSSPFIPLSDKDAGDTDETRPAFAQRGNTYMELRNIDNSTAANSFGNQYQFQYYGLASEFRNLTLTGRLDYDYFSPVRLSLQGEFTQNLAYDERGIAARAVNNMAAGGSFDGGDTAWYLALTAGSPAVAKWGDWQVYLGYRHIESDAVVDGFTDSDFGGGGTNVEGFTLGGRFGLTENVSLGLKWMSSDEIGGPPLRSDTLQLDLNAKF